MKKIDRVLEGEKLYPKLNNKYIKLSIMIDINENRTLINEVFDGIDYEKVKEKIILDENYKKEIINKMYNRFHIEDYSLITDATHDVWYFVKLMDTIPTNKYSMLYISNVESLNVNNYFENYIDLFGQEVIFDE